MSNVPTVKKYSPCSRGLKALLGNSKGVKQVFPVLAGVEGKASNKAQVRRRRLASLFKAMLIVFTSCLRWLKFQWGP